MKPSDYVEYTQLRQQIGSLEEAARRKEKLMSVNHFSVSPQFVKDAKEIDDMYVKAIQSKIGLLDNML